MTKGKATLLQFFLIALTALVLALLFVGCEKHRSPMLMTDANIALLSAEISDANKFLLLRVEAKRRGLKFHVFCFDKDDGSFGYQGSAWYPGHESTDDTSDRWFVVTDSPANAAYALYVVIQGRATSPGRPREEMKKKQRKICAFPQITSESDPKDDGRCCEERP